MTSNTPTAPYLADPDVTLYAGDALAVLRELPDESVHCIATSPPFFALRDYGTGRWEGGDEGCDHVKSSPEQIAALARNSTLTSGRIDKTHNHEFHLAQYRDTCGKCGANRIDQQIGLEPTPDEWAARLVEVFREARRVLRRDGTLWVECGDGYAHPAMGGTAGSSPDGPRGGRLTETGRSPSSMGPGLKQKDLIGQPWLLAFALRADGWWLRGCNIWAKPNAMPESAKDRCTTAHSYVFQLSRSARYFFDGDAISEPFGNEAPRGSLTRRKDGDGSGDGRHERFLKYHPVRELQRQQVPQVETLDGSNGEAPRGPDGRRVTHVEAGPSSIQHRDGERWPNDAKHPRSVWTIPTQGFPEAHFATWPEALARRIILAGCPEWVCSVCGKARERITSIEYGKSPAHGAGSIVGSRGVTERGSSHLTEGATNKEGRGGQPRVAKLTTTEGWTDCDCIIRCPTGVACTGCRYCEALHERGKYIPGTVLDPFAGSGTTLYVARKLGRRGIGIDLNPEYLEMAARRLQQQSLFAQEIA